MLAARNFGNDTVSGRIDTFRTKDRTFRAIDDNQENGWAATASWRHRLAPHADLILEAQPPPRRSRTGSRKSTLSSSD